MIYTLLPPIALVAASYVSLCGCDYMSAARRSAADARTLGLTAVLSNDVVEGEKLEVMGSKQ